MQIISTSRLLGFCLAVAALSGASAQAQTVSIANGNFLTYDGLTYTISGCAFTLAGASSTCAAANASLTANSSSGGSSISVVSSNSGQPLMSLATGQGSGVFDDLTFVLTLTAASAKATISSLTDSIIGSDTINSNGTANTAFLKNLTAGATLTLPTGVSAAVTPSGAQTGTSPPTYSISPTGNTAGTPSSATATFTPAFNPTPGVLASDLQVQIDLGVKSGPTAGDTISLTSVTYTSTPAPEPTSVAVLATGIAGLVRIRSRRRRDARPA